MRGVMGFLLACALFLGCDAADGGKAIDCGEASEADCDRCGTPPAGKLLCPTPDCPFRNPPSECYPVCSAGYCFDCVDDSNGGWTWIEVAYDCIQD